MSNVINAQAPNYSILDNARGALVEGATKTGDLIKGYAKVLCEVFDVRAENGQLVTCWFDLVGKDKKGIKEERVRFAAAMVARGHVKADGKPSPTVDTYWQRVKEASGYVPKGRVTGGTDVDAKTAAELKTIINRILKGQEDGQSNHADTILETLKDAFVTLTGETFDADK